MGAYSNIRTSVLDKKKAALVALGSLAEHAPRAFYPHLPLAMETLNAQVCDCGCVSGGWRKLFAWFVSGGWNIATLCSEAVGDGV